jgi:endonuclease III
MGEEADTTAVDTHVNRVDRQRHLLDDLALVLRREDLATNKNE